MHRRISLIARSDATPDRDWNDAGTPTARLLFTESFAALRFALRAGTGAQLDIERVVVDSAATPADFLDLLATLPHEFTGDVLLIGSEKAYLSASGRGGDRVLYALRDIDVRFYLETHDLVTGRVAERMAS
ncbi:MAG TPA: hypothetical protein VGF48_24275 [Thermoanaerobaculia bacterium]|jgi:hypothetical protein